MRQETRRDHELRIEDAIRYVLDHLDEPIDLGELADHVCMSRFHFHRVFQALLGETVTEMARRLRLERAAKALRTTKTPITELAFECGYATHEAFIRAFRTAFGCTPTTMRKRLQYEGRLPTQNGIHFGHRLHFRFVPSRGENAMNVEIREMPPKKAVCMPHSGPYFMIGQTFGKFGAWMQQSQAPCGEGVAFFYDDPESTMPEKLRSDAGMFVPEDYRPSDPQVHLVDVEGGSFAVHTHLGSYDGLSGAWKEFTSKQLPDGFTYRNATPFEVYVKMDEEIGGAKSITELYMPVKAVS